MYLEHFGIKKFPFTLTPNTQFYCNLPGCQEALNILLFSLNSGEGFIEVVGEVGSGKTILCRKLLNTLRRDFVTAYLPSPDLTPNELRRAFAGELKIKMPDDIDQLELLRLLSKKLLDLRAEDKKVVLVVDEAQALSDESLEALRLLTNLETESEKLLQIVLFGQPELENKLRQYHFRQLRQRITFSYYLSPLDYTDLVDYVRHRLLTAGSMRGLIFSQQACRLLFQASGGVPRIINILSHKAMLVAYGKGDKRVNSGSVKRAIEDSQNIVEKKHWAMNNWAMNKWIVFLIIILFFVVPGLIYEYSGYFFDIL